MQGFKASELIEMAVNQAHYFGEPYTKYPIGWGHVGPSFCLCHVLTDMATYGLVRHDNLKIASEAIYDSLNGRAYLWSHLILSGKLKEGMYRTKEHEAAAREHWAKVIVDLKEKGL